MEQMTLKEKLAFLKGFVVASQLSGEEREIFKKFFDFLEAVAGSIKELDERLEDLEDRMEIVESEVYNDMEIIENDIYSTSKENEK